MQKSKEHILKMCVLS